MCSAAKGKLCIPLHHGVAYLSRIRGAKNRNKISQKELDREKMASMTYFGLFISNIVDLIEEGTTFFLISQLL